MSDDYFQVEDIEAEQERWELVEVTQFGLENGYEPFMRLKGERDWARATLNASGGNRRAPCPERE